MTMIMTDVAVAILALSVLAIFVRHVLFTPIEEACPATDPSALREVLLPDLSRFRRTGLLRLSRRGGCW
jgi:hypothetical protein